MSQRNRGRPINYEMAKEVLQELFALAEENFQADQPPDVPSSFAAAADLLFRSKTQSFREVALGCALVRLLDKEANLRLPYVNQGSSAYNGRTLDERVVNPFLHDRQIPASKGPYLATFRRSVRFEDSTRGGMRDKEGYDALLAVLTHLEATTDDQEIRSFTRYLLFGFVRLRDAAQVPVARINRLNLQQYDNLLQQLLETPSGGLVPVLLTVALLQALQKCFALNWTIEWQGINVADRVSGAGGDVTVWQGNEVHFALEITERPIDRSRVVSTFNTKISPGGIADYLFIFTRLGPSNEAKQYAYQLFSQGHDVNFVELKPWLIHNLSTIGSGCRASFTQEFLGLLSDSSVPATLKVKWNDLVKQLFA
jgi:hypothetical protein